MIIRLSMFVLVLFCLFSCSSHQKPDAKSGADSLSHGSDSGNTNLAFKTIHVPLSFAGVWVNQLYADSIRKNRSPRLDQRLVSESSVEIPDSTLKETLYIYGFHEGGTAMVVVKKGSLYQFYDPELKIPLDTIELLSPTRIRIGKNYFQKLKYADKDKSEWGILNELLIGGKYQTTDGKQVEFEMNGHITGLDTVTYYEPVADYTEEGLEIDRIDMGQSSKKTSDYGFQFDKDTLLIYRIYPDSAAQNPEGEKLGELRWKLRKTPE